MFVVQRIQRIAYKSRKYAGVIVLLAVALSAGAALMQVSAGSSFIDLAIEPAGLTVHVEDAEGYLGSSVASGDVNGDGVDDLIVGSFGADPNGRIDAGKVYIIFGDADLLPAIDLETTEADVTVLGASAGDFLGFAVTSGDVNGDAIDDVIVSARLANPLSRNDAGEIYVFFGGPDLPANIDLATTNADVSIAGANNSDQLGYGLAIGDINGDGIDDLISGAFLANTPGGPNAGETIVIYGSVTLPPQIDLLQGADVILLGRDGEDRSGWAVASGDLNGDGYDDLISGARLAEQPGGNERGETYVVFGGPSLPTSIDLSLETPDITVFGAVDLDRSGQSVAAGDLNGDGFDDLVIAAHHASPLGGWAAGKVYVFRGATSLPPEIYITDSTQEFLLLGDDPFDYLGTTLIAADFNNDGFDDLLSGAFDADGPGTGTSCGDNTLGDRCASGEAYLIYGSQSLAGSVDFNSASADLTIYGAAPTNRFGYTLAAGDINDDSITDMVISGRLPHAGGEGTPSDIHVIWGVSTPKDPDADTDGDTIPNSSDLDDDDDGCTDAQENGPDEMLGGQRNPHNAWDFYDVLGPGAALPTDGVIDLPNDILGVIRHFSPTGAMPYDVRFDRGPRIGANPWDMTAPDGVIDLPNDILGVIQQFNHRCV